MTPIHYTYPNDLEQLWNHACSLYRGGQTDPGNYFDAGQRAVLARNGLTVREIFDFVEDFCRHGEPDFTTFMLVTDVRRSWFFDQMAGVPSGKTVDPATYPPKTDAADGIVWLPRILAKAKAKLRGDLGPETMYGCGGDRSFLKTHDLHMAEFLRKVADHYDHEQAVIDWVKYRSAAGADPTPG